MVVIAAACWLGGCTPPVLERVDPDLVQAQVQEVQVQVKLDGDSGGNFSSNDTYRLAIEGNIDGGSGITVVGPLTVLDNQTIQTQLTIAPDAVGGERAVTVVNSSGPSEPAPFFVQCVGCPPPPEFFDFSFGTSIAQGTTSIVQLDGRNFSDPDNPSILPSVLPDAGFGLIVDQSGVVVSSGDCCDHEVINVPVTALPDAPTGYHYFRVFTRGGRSNRQHLYVKPPERPILRVTNATVVGGGCIRDAGEYNLIITGENFDAYVSSVYVNAYKGTTPVMTSDYRWHTVDDSHTIHALLFLSGELGHPPADNFEVGVISTSGDVGILKINCDSGPIPSPTPTPTATPSPTPTPTPKPSPTPTLTPTPTAAGPPVLSFVTPDHVTKGTDVFIKCDGNNFSSSGLSTGRTVVTTPLLSGTTLATVQADPRKVAVARLSVPATITGPITIQVRDNSTGQISNPIPLQLDDPPMPTGPPYITKLVSLTGSDITPLRRNFATNGKANTGSYDLADSTGWITVPGVTFTSTLYNNSTGVLSFQVQADGTAPYSGDEATNVIRTTIGKGDGNPVALPINP